jgi:hypothetical protein
MLLLTPPMPRVKQKAKAARRRICPRPVHCWFRTPTARSGHLGARPVIRADLIAKLVGNEFPRGAHERGHPHIDLA